MTTPNDWTNYRQYIVVEPNGGYSIEIQHIPETGLWLDPELHVDRVWKDEQGYHAHLSHVSGHSLGTVTSKTGTDKLAVGANDY